MFSRIIILLVASWGLVFQTCAQIVSYTPSEGFGVSYGINIPITTVGYGSGPIYFQLKGPSELKWMALGQGGQMTEGNLFVVYSAPDGNVTLSPRRGIGHYEPVYDSSVRAHLLDGSGVRDGVMTANVRCDNCMELYSGKSIMGDHSPWIWAVTRGEALETTNVSYRLYQHDWHGVVSLDMKKAVGGSSPHPFSSPLYTLTDVSASSKQQQIDDTLLHKKRIAHGTMTSIAFVLLFPGFGLTLHLISSRHTVAWIHAPLQIFAVLLALAGYGVGISVADDLQDAGGYHPVLGHIAVIGVALFQPILGIVQHLRFRKSGEKTYYGVSHRWLGRFLAVLGIVNGGIGFHYAYSKNPDIPLSSPISYGLISGSVGIIYILVLVWKRRQALSGEKKSIDQNSSSNGDIESTIVQDEKADDFVEVKF